MINEAMITRAKKIVDDGDVEYVNTNGNMLNFQGRGHNTSKDKVYLITGEIQQNNEIEWTCDCHHAQFNDECKHMLACAMLMKNKGLRDEYKAFSNDEDKHYHDDDEVIGKIKIEKDDD